MAIKPDVNYPTKTTPGGASYPYGSARNVTVPGDGTGTPFEQAWVNDIWGLLQKLLNDAGVVPSGAADTILASDYFTSLEKLFSRYFVYDDTGPADAVALASVSGADPAAYTDGLPVLFKVNATNTGATTLKIAALANIAVTSGGVALTGGELVAGQYMGAVYRSAGPAFEIAQELTAESVTKAKLSNSATDADNVLSRVSKAWVNFNGTGAVAIRDSFNVSSITDNGVGDYTVNFTNNMANLNYSPMVVSGLAIGSRSTVHSDYGTVALGSVRVLTGNSAAAAQDHAAIDVNINATE